MDVAELDRSLERRMKALILKVWRYKFTFAATVLIVSSAILVVVLSLQPVYEGSTLLMGGQTNLEQLPDPTRKPVQTSSALSRIAESEEVVTRAVETVGLSTVVQNMRPNTSSIFARLRRRLLPSPAPALPSFTPIEAYLPRIKQALTVRGEQDSDIIRIAFRNRDPVVAAEFANAVAQAFVDRQLALYSRPGAADFFARQRQHFDDEVQRTSGELEKFSVDAGIYSVDDQRKLLLGRMSDLAAALAQTREALSEKAGQREALAEQLRKLAPVARSQYVSSLVDALGPSRATATPHPPDSRAIDDRVSDPPLLLVKVYQDSMEQLFQVNAEIGGLQNRERQQMDETAKVISQLNGLTSNEQRFAALKRAVAQATSNSTTNANRMVEEESNAALSAAKFSSVKILQKATVPLRPVFPNYVMFVLAAAVVGIMAGVAAAALRSAMSRSAVSRLPSSRPDW